MCPLFFFAKKNDIENFCAIYTVLFKIFQSVRVWQAKKFQYLLQMIGDSCQGLKTAQDSQAQVAVTI